MTVFDGVATFSGPCGGCAGMGSHRKHCPRNPNYTYLGYLADLAEDMGDRIGGTDPGAANHCYAASGILRTRHERVLDEKRNARED